jgi:deoxyhypusine synthase
MKLEKTKPVDVRKGKQLTDLLNDMFQTGFQGRNLSMAYRKIKQMIEDDDVTILLGYAGSLSTTGQRKIIQWMIEENLIDILVSTGANISEDLIEGMGFSYYQCPEKFDDKELFELGYNRYLDVLGREDDYMVMTEKIAEFMQKLNQDHLYSSRELLSQFGKWLSEQKIDGIVTSAYKAGVPVFCPAIIDSPYGDAALIAKAYGFSLKIDAVKDYTEFMSLATHVKETGVIYIGGGVPKDMIQLFAVTGDLLYKDRVIPNRHNEFSREGTDETYYPHKYAVQITTDSPQWGGLSGCTFQEATSWGKESENHNYVQVYCDATIALPVISQALADNLATKRKPKELVKKL